jgi:hypothetical protein
MQCEKLFHEKFLLAKFSLLLFTDSLVIYLDWFHALLKHKCCTSHTDTSGEELSKECWREIRVGQMFLAVQTDNMHTGRLSSRKIVFVSTTTGKFSIWKKFYLLFLAVVLSSRLLLVSIHKCTSCPKVLWPSIFGKYWSTVSNSWWNIRCRRPEIVCENLCQHFSERCGGRGGLRPWPTWSAELC